MREKLFINLKKLHSTTRIHKYKSKLLSQYQICRTHLQRRLKYKLRLFNQNQACRMHPLYLHSMNIQRNFLNSNNSSTRFSNQRQSISAFSLRSCFTTTNQTPRSCTSKLPINSSSLLAKLSTTTPGASTAKTFTVGTIIARSSNGP